MRVLVIAVAVLPLLGCRHATPIVSRPPKPTRLVPVRTTAPFAGDVQCVYYKDYDSGDFYRVSLDGKVRERVLKGDKADTVRLSVDFLDKSSWRLNVGGEPTGAAYTVLEKIPARTRHEPYYENSTTEPAYFANSDAPCAWTIKFHRRTFEIEPGHFHYGWDKVEYIKAGKSHVYDFYDEEPNQDNVWLIDDEHAIVFDNPNVITWNLSTGEQTCIANALMAEVWPRDLHKPERMKPLAHGANKSWTMSSPDDVDPLDH